MLHRNHLFKFANHSQYHFIIFGNDCQMKSFDEQNIKVMFEDNEELKEASLLEI